MSAARLALCSLLLAAPLGAADLALTGATVHTVSGPTLEKATILIEEGSVVAVGRAVSVPGASRCASAGFTPAVVWPCCRSWPRS